MTRPRRIWFSVNDYYDNGEIAEDGVFLHFGDTRVKVVDSVGEFHHVVHEITTIFTALKETYPDEFKVDP